MAIQPGIDNIVALKIVVANRPVQHHLCTIFLSAAKVSLIKEFTLGSSSCIAGLQVTSRRPCWWSRTKAFLSAGK